MYMTSLLLSAVGWLLLITTITLATPVWSGRGEVSSSAHLSPALLGLPNTTSVSMPVGGALKWE